MENPSLFLYWLPDGLCWIYHQFDFQDRLSSPHPIGLSQRVVNLERSEGIID